jgi:heterodisulfide reductase subunit C
MSLLKKQVVKYDELDKEFLEKIKSLSGENPLLCYRCGVCSGGCPMVSEMDVTPSTLMRLVQLGQKNVLESKTIELCVSCFTCTVRCPRGLDLAKVAEALRQIKLRKNIDFIRIGDISKEEMSRLPQIALVSNFRKLTA